MLLATPSLLLTTANKHREFNYDENAREIKNSVNSSSSSISECSSESPPRPLSSSSLSGNIENAYDQNNLQTKSKYVSHHNARYQAMPYYNCDHIKNSQHAIDNYTINTVYPFTQTDLQSQNYVYNQHCQQYNEYTSYNMNQQQRIANYQDLTTQQQTIVNPYQVSSCNELMTNSCYPTYTSSASNGSPCVSQIPNSMSDPSQFISNQYNNFNTVSSNDSKFYTKKRNCSEFETSCYSNSESSSLSTSMCESPDDSLSSGAPSLVSKKKNTKNKKDKTGKQKIICLEINKLF